MASSELMECGICKEGFNEEKHRPLLLLCSHSFCKHCIDGFICYKKQQCPVCRKDFQASTSEDLPVNRALLDLIKYTKEIEARKPELVMPCEGWQAPQKEDEDKRQKTKAEMEKLIQIDETMIKELQNFNKAVKEIVEDNEKLIDDITEHKLKLQNQMKDLMDMDKKITEAQSKFKQAINFTAAGPIMDAISSMMKDLHVTLHDIKLVIDGNRTLLDTIDENSKASQKKLNGFQEIQNLIKTLDDDFAKVTWELDNGGEANKERPLIYMSNDEFESASGEIYVVASVDGKRKYTKVIKRDKTVTHVPNSKEDQTIPSTARFLKHEYFTFLIPGYPKAYMDLSLKNKPLGRIIIAYKNIDGYSDHIENHMKLISGELGPSFLNSNLLEVKNIGTCYEQVVFGDYEKNDGTGGKAVLETGEQWWKKQIDLRNCSYYLYCLEPISSDEATASQFRIYTRMNTKRCFGKIEEGYNILKTALEKYETELLRDIRISNCGLIYSMK